MPESRSSAIAVVSTSLHMLYLCEFVHRHQVDELEIVVLLKRPTDRAQIEQVLAEVPCQAVHWIDATSRIANHFISVYELYGLQQLNLSRAAYNYGVFADYGRSMLANITCGEYVWLGDGTKIIYETSDRGRAALSRHTLQAYADPVTRLLARKRLLLDKQPRIYSPFELGVEGQEKNDFGWLRSRYQGLDSCANGDKPVYFFGSYFSERGGRVLMEDEDYLAYMEQVVAHFSEQGTRLVYVPHRHEGADKLARIAALPGVTVQAFNYPAEMEFYKRGERPAHLASFFSTCLIHFQLMGVAESVTSFYIDFSQHDASYRPVAEEIYKSIRNTLGEQSMIALDNSLRRVA